jgi:23S rRNA-/tRNA-specific pseudouridylate synthase
VYLGIVHRLDRAASGVLLWAKTQKAARRLSRQFQTRRVVKEYWAIVELIATKPNAKMPPHVSFVGPPVGEETWLDYLTRPDKSGVVHAVPELTRGAREALARAAPAAAMALPCDCAWLRLWPETGRTHQLRVQTASRGMPVLGDLTYGSRRPFDPPDGVALHAFRLQVRHPMLGTELVLLASPPPEWAAQGIILPEPGDL